jgi:transcriptional regulator with GAF, ATPase, and Fis domain
MPSGKESPAASSPPGAPGSFPTYEKTRIFSIEPAVFRPISEAFSFICVPDQDRRPHGRRLSVDKAISSEEQLRSDAKFLDITAAFLAQAIQINRMVMRQKEELLEENAQLRAQVRDRYRFENVIGDSPAMHDVSPLSDRSPTAGRPC